MTAPRQLDLLVRYLDVTLVVAAAPVFVLGELPLLGYLIAAVTWVATRYGVAVAQRRALAAGNPGRQAATLLATMMARVLAIVAAILIARFAGGTDDGIAAAAVALAAFTLQLLVTISLRSYAPRPGGSA
jgi:hypothetical protein